MENKILRYKIYVKGRVQGVGFRWRTVHEARRLDIKGFVRNMPDGSVYIEAEGPEEKLIELADWCRKGPGFVESVTIDPYPPVNYRDFRIEY